ncbi:MAG TPA: hypothetical protein VLK82_07790 [Candidatus Tectomicrobia bacterium]|nr:hypothetical protein [Candidatus Tectomicrobia bacterium]
MTHTDVDPMTPQEFAGMAYLGRQITQLFMRARLGAGSIHQTRRERNTRQHRRQLRHRRSPDSVACTVGRSSASFVPALHLSDTHSTVVAQEGSRYNRHERAPIKPPQLAGQVCLLRG